MKAMKARIRRNPIFWILLTAPLALLLLCQLQPTFDDWTYYTVPPTAITGGLSTCYSGICSGLITGFSHS